MGRYSNEMMQATGYTNNLITGKELIQKGDDLSVRT